MPEWFQQLFQADGLSQLIAQGGVWLIAAIVFAETGLLVGFFLPGDSLLFLAGSLCALNPFDGTKPPPLSLWPTGIALVVAAVLGNTVNYWLGKWSGDRIWSRPDGRLIKRRYLEEAHAFYERWGGLSLVLTRFIPIARTFTPFVAGAARMSFARYTLWNIAGALVWVASLLAAGYWLGRIPFVQKHIETIILGIVAISVAPVAVGVAIRWWRGRGQEAGKPAPEQAS